MAQRQNKNLIKEIEKLLNQQTITILSAVDEKLKRSEERINKKIEKLTVTAATFNLVNTTATTVNFAGAATTLNIGAGGTLARTFHIGTGTGIDTINIGTGATGADVITIGGGAGTLAIDTANWDVSPAGALSGLTGLISLIP